jgi:RNA polymerase sigma factor (sigma-70 family)
MRGLSREKVPATPERAFDIYHEAVFRFVYRLTRRADVAEDVTQECFLTLVRAPGRFNEARGSLKTYLFAIARNPALKHHRDRAADVQLDEDAIGHRTPVRREGTRFQSPCRHIVTDQCSMSAFIVSRP